MTGESQCIRTYYTCAGGQTLLVPILLLVSLLPPVVGTEIVHCIYQCGSGYTVLLHIACRKPSGSVLLTSVLRAFPLSM